MRHYRIEQNNLRTTGVYIHYHRLTLNLNSTNFCWHLKNLISHIRATHLKESTPNRLQHQLNFVPHSATYFEHGRSKAFHILVPINCRVPDWIMFSMIRCRVIWRPRLLSSGRRAKWTGNEALAEDDPEMWQLIGEEKNRQVKWPLFKTVIRSRFEILFRCLELS